MQLKQISEWVNKDDMEVLLSDEEIKSWLLEKGPITKRIKLNHNFELNLIRDEVDQISPVSYTHLTLPTTTLV